MAGLIGQFPGGGENVTTEVNAQEDLIAAIEANIEGKRFYNQQEKTITPTDEVQVVFPDAGYLFNKVTVDASNKSGLHVWKKFTRTETPQSVVNPSFSQTLTSYTAYVTITSPNFDFTQVGDYVNFFDGFTNSAGTLYYYKEGNTLKCQLIGYVATVTAFSVTNATTARLDFSSAYQGGGSGTLSYSGTKTLNNLIEDTFDSYVVSDNENQYPDGDVLDGYFYEKARLGISPEMFGCTRIAIDEVEWTGSDLYTNSIFNHSLGEIPNVALILAPFKNTSNVLRLAFLVKNTSNSSNTGIVFNQTGLSVICSNVTLTSSTLSPNSNQFVLDYGKQYYIVTMA